MIRYLFLFLSLTVGVQLLAQHQNPLWIPFNDHGKWGYCDTLGTLQIEPAYESASFFYPMNIGAEKYFVSRVETSRGNNLVMSNGELVFPAKLDFVDNIYSKASPNNLFLLRKKGKYGVFKYGESWVMPAKYDMMGSGFDFSSMYLFKREKDNTYQRFYPETLELKETDIIDVGVFYHGFNTVEVVTKTDGSRYEVQNAELIPIDLAKYAEYQDLGDVMLEEVPEEWSNSFSWEGTKPTAEALGVDRVLDYKDYTSIGLGSRYGFERIIIAEKNGQMGIINEKGEEVLPFQYDRLRMDVNNTQVILEKDGKVGRKLLFTHYPSIEPRYDKLRLANQLRVSSNWSFGIFEVVLNEQSGYVGENAVEYFDFK
jgi:hypothetical protein